MAGWLLYRSERAYLLVMRALYGRHYQARYRALADLIAPGAEVLDLCCGPGILYRRYLRPKGVDYRGLDVNPRFVARLRSLHVRAEAADLRRPAPLPRADVVVMQASLYHFLPDPEPVLERMLASARRQVLIAEPVRNLSSSRFPLDRGPGPPCHQGRRSGHRAVRRGEPRRADGPLRGPRRETVPHPRGA